MNTGNDTKIYLHYQHDEDLNLRCTDLRQRSVEAAIIIIDVTNIELFSRHDLWDYVVRPTNRLTDHELF